jgi:hypothetical protein
MPLEGWIQHCPVAQFFYDWQTIIAGLAALLAAIITVWVTLRVERRASRREVDALRKSLGTELRLHIGTALVVYDGLYGLFRSKKPITARMVENKSQMAAPIIYPANAGKIGLLGAEAMDVMRVYDLLETARNGAARLMNFYAPNDISAPYVMETADAFLAACIFARRVLPKLRTGDRWDDATDKALMQKINEALETQSAAFAARGA